MIMMVVAVALIDADGRILVQQRPLGKAHGGLWEFPGGKVESGEVPEAALVRELREELGIDVAPDDLAPLTFASELLADRHLVLLLYRCRQWEGVARPLDAAALRWVDVDDLAALDMPPADRPFVAVLAADRRR
jgi:8-oxo-dGTP diphosphatase